MSSWFDDKAGGSVQYADPELFKEKQNTRRYTQNNNPRYSGIMDDATGGYYDNRMKHGYSGNVDTPDSLIPEFDRRFSGVGGVAPTGQWFDQAAGGMGVLQDRAYGLEDSPWAEKLYEQQAIQQWEAEQQLSNQQHQQYAMANDRLAQTGGLDSGARERLGEKAMRSEMLGRQGLAREGELQRLGIGINDEAQRLELQKQLPGMFQGMDQYEREGEMYNDQMDYRKGALWSDMAGREYDANWKTDAINAERYDKVNWQNTENLIQNRKDKYAGDRAWWDKGAEIESSERLAQATEDEANSEDDGLFGWGFLGL